MTKKIKGSYKAYIKLGKFSDNYEHITKEY